MVPMNHKKNYTSAFVIVTVLFFLWGFITVLVDSLVPRLREVFELSYGMITFLQSAFFVAYFVFSIPAGGLISKIGYQKGVVIGLVTMSIGCLLFYPASEYRIFGVFLIAFFMLAGGITILQVAANPYVAVLGSEDKASSRLNLSQAFNSFGASIAPLVGAVYLLSDKILSGEEISQLSIDHKKAYYAQEAAAVQTPFLVFSLLILLLGITFLYIKLPKILESENTSTYRKALKSRTVWLGILAIFFYVGAEVTIGTAAITYFMEMNLDQIIRERPFLKNTSFFIIELFGGDTTDIDGKGIVGAFLTFYWLGAMIGRFIGAYLTKIFKPTIILAVFGLTAISLILISVYTEGLISMWSLLIVGLFNSIMFPTIFTSTLDGQGDLKPKISGLLCMAIVGGGIILPIFGFIADFTSFKIALTLLTLCYGYVAYFAFSNYAKNNY
jgi:FHS family L-fucose permease-like MFS transporter